MSHRDSCPTDWEARREGERAFDRGYGSNPYRGGYGEDRCEEAERAWRRGYSAAEERHSEERAAERAAQRRAYERVDEDAYYAEQERRYYDEQLWAEQHPLPQQETPDDEK